MPVVIICFFVLTSALGLCWALVPRFRRRSTGQWLTRRVGQVSVADAELVERVRFGRSVGASVGGLAGVAAASVITALAPLDESFRAWPVVLGFAVGVLLGQSVSAFRQVFATPAGDVRLARTRPARLADHLPAVMRWSVGLALGLALASGLGSLVVMVLADGRAALIGGIVAGIVLTLVVAGLSLHAARQLIRRPQPADTRARMATLQALRTEQVHDLVGMQVTFALCTAALAASPLQDETLRLTGVPDALLLVPLVVLGLVFVLAGTALLSSVLAQLTGSTARLNPADA